jgi:hypothetical protein
MSTTHLNHVRHQKATLSNLHFRFQYEANNAQITLSVVKYMCIRVIKRVGSIDCRNCSPFGLERAKASYGAPSLRDSRRQSVKAPSVGSAGAFTDILSFRVTMCIRIWVDEYLQVASSSSRLQLCLIRWHCQAQKRTATQLASPCIATHCTK